ncbi:MAG: hypothetical protein GF418_16020 [Chitinivibrionales bacterium]|nr:hypothetical protein [Chitinivibrionales bacterium]
MFTRSITLKSVRARACIGRAVLLCLGVFAAGSITSCGEEGPTQAEVDRLSSEIDSLSREIQLVSRDVDGLDDEIETLTGSVTSLRARIAALEDNGFTDFYIKSGVLYDSNRNIVNSVYYWRINIYVWDIASYDSCLVQTWVRQNSGYLWKVPTWYLYDTGDVRIIDDVEADHGYEYKVLVAYRHD